ncbi:unnamed protein product [Brassica rapa]|uniref:Uncharacterized protein n=1 Tax=Brassica campestris TaxID=3711 RepID=A0A8D9FZD4_BRACM|nr:unnamed protein product [Brassica rapa]
MCTAGQPRTSCVCCRTHTDTHGRPVFADGHPQTWRTPTDVLCVLNRQPTWAKITQTVHRKGQRAESKDQRADMCIDGQPQTSYVFSDGHTRTHTEVLCVLTDTHRRPVCADGQPGTATDVLCVMADTHGHTMTATFVLCVLTDSHGQPRTRPVCTEQTAHVGQNHPSSP